MKYFYLGLVSIALAGQVSATNQQEEDFAAFAGLVNLMNVEKPQEDGFATGKWTGTFYTANGIVVRHTPGTNAITKNGFCTVNFGDLPFTRELDINGSFPEEQGVLKLTSSLENYRREVSKIAAIVREEDVYTGVRPTIFRDDKGNVTIAGSVGCVVENDPNGKPHQFVINM